MTEKRCITVAGAPPAIGPYSHAVAVGELVFFSGQIPLNPDGSGLIKGNFEDQARQALTNLKTVLEGAGSSIDLVVKAMIFLTDLDNFAVFNAIYEEYFGDSKPARSCIEVARLPAGAEVEVEVIALLKAN